MHRSRVCVQNQVFLERCLLDHLENIRDILQWVSVGRPLIKYCAFHFFYYMSLLWSTPQTSCVNLWSTQVFSLEQLILLRAIFLFSFNNKKTDIAHHTTKSRVSVSNMTFYKTK